MSEPVQFPVSLDEFCKNLSMSDRRVELISMFHFEQKHSGNVFGLPSKFRAAFADLEAQTARKPKAVTSAGVVQGVPPAPSPVPEPVPDAEAERADPTAADAALSSN
jgi:hypothetical protein